MRPNELDDARPVTVGGKGGFARAIAKAAAKAAAKRAAVRAAEAGADRAADAAKAADAERAKERERKRRRNEEKVRSKSKPRGVEDQEVDAKPRADDATVRSTDDTTDKPKIVPLLDRLHERAGRASLAVRDVWWPLAEAEITDRVRTNEPSPSSALVVESDGARALAFGTLATACDSAASHAEIRHPTHAAVPPSARTALPFAASLVVWCATQYAEAAAEPIVPDTDADANPPALVRAVRAADALADLIDLARENATSAEFDAVHRVAWRTYAFVRGRRVPSEILFAAAWPDRRPRSLDTSPDGGEWALTRAARAVLGM